jgi:hypothetical protein
MYVADFTLPFRNFRQRLKKTHTVKAKQCKPDFICGYCGCFLMQLLCGWLEKCLEKRDLRTLNWRSVCVWQTVPFMLRLNKGGPKIVLSPKFTFCSSAHDIVTMVTHPECQLTKYTHLLLEATAKILWVDSTRRLTLCIIALKLDSLQASVLFVSHFEVVLLVRWMCVRRRSAVLVLLAAQCICWWDRATTSSIGTLVGTRQLTSALISVAQAFVSRRIPLFPSVSRLRQILQRRCVCVCGGCSYV